MLAFNPATHSYTVGGRQVPSVTGRIRAAGLLGPAVHFFTPDSAARGTRVHLACLAIDHGLPPLLPLEERGYLLSYRRWRDAMRPQWTSLETPHYCAQYDTAGTADRLGLLDDVPVVVELKTGGAASWHGVQLAMYDLLHNDLAPRQRRRLVLHLSTDGRMAHVVEYHEANDYLTALDLLTKGSADAPDRPDADSNPPPAHHHGDSG